MYKVLLGLLVSATVISCCAQNEDPSQKFARLIDSADLRKHLTVLASDEYEGRETGKNGQKMAEAYIRNVYEQLGCGFVPGTNGYEQYFEVVETTPGGTMRFGEKGLLFKTDFVYFGAKRKVSLSNLPVYIAEDALRAKPDAYVLIARLKGMDVQSELAEIRKNQPNGAKAIVLVTDKYKDLYEYLDHYATGKSMRLKDAKAKTEVPVIVINADALKGIMKKQFAWITGTGKEKKSRKVNTVANLSAELNIEGETLQSSNVLAFIQGSDPVLSKEVVVITAHYDHIGIENGVVYNGADDDGTGTVALLEIAQAFMAAKRNGAQPKRSILIMAVSGEEKGLLGSSYYVNHPLVPLENTITDLNIDMIGRNDIAHKDTSGYIYIIGSSMLSMDLHRTNEWANERYIHLKLDYRFNKLDDPNQFYYRSDHYNFAKNNIPSIFYFSGVHEDYHQPGDDVWKIDFQKVQQVARLVFHTAWQIADNKERPALDF